MEISLRIENLQPLDSDLKRLSGEQLRAAFAKAINDTAFQLRRGVQDEMRRVFDRPTPYILSSPRVVMATPARLTASVLPTYMGGKGIDPQKILQAQEFGGPRRDKRSEAAFRRAGILPRGYYLAIPKTPYPGSDDGRGNLRGPFLVQLITYFQASGEQGYKANMTDKRKRSIHKGTAKTAGRRYFVTYGHLRSGKTQHLAPGIWAAQGAYGVDIRPVVMFVRTPNYKPLMSMERVAQAVNVQEYLDRRVRYRVREAAGV
ncbi:hypothetical protein [Polaromonas naphthalenivorans]|uniref:Phage protein n=1 Tax=Polaromonas naphthalenivorans (strain CJ2) TaxID=365044 RepID=A1VPI9_POLNA|nr:hypothetical protein [Polaromonas naphthalenivorans]ABM37567.1 conserved hypothetical protein [Polaromonas naphthalenivorans CJ2]